MMPNVQALQREGTWWKYREVKGTWTTDRIRTYKYEGKLYRITDTVPNIFSLHGPHGEYNQVALEQDQDMKQATHVAFVWILSDHGVPILASWRQGTHKEVLEWAQEEATRLGGHGNVEKLKKD